MHYPLYLINFKTYKQATGERAVKLATKLAEVRKEAGCELVVAPQPTDLRQVSSIIPSVAQHLDPIGYGSNTGWLLPEAAKQAGAKGTLINHSEHNLTVNEIEKRVERAGSVGLQTICCAPSPAKAREIAKLEPDAVAYEPPELIGTGRSVSSEKPEFIRRAVEAVKEVSRSKVLCGAGISSRQDVKKAFELGTEGILVASSVVKAKSPAKAARELIVSSRNYIFK